MFQLHLHIVTVIAALLAAEDHLSEPEKDSSRKGLTSYKPKTRKQNIW